MSMTMIVIWPWAICTLLITTGTEMVIIHFIHIDKAENTRPKRYIYTVAVIPVIKRGEHIQF